MDHVYISLGAAEVMLQHTIDNGGRLAGAGAQDCPNPHYLHTFRNFNT